MYDPGLGRISLSDGATGATHRACDKRRDRDGLVDRVCGDVCDVYEVATFEGKIRENHVFFAY